MAKAYRSYRNTFGNLKKALLEKGFTAIGRDGVVIFKHKSGRPIFMLPEYKSNQAVRPIHLMMVRKQIEDAGLTFPDSPRPRAPRAPSTPTKA